MKWALLPHSRLQTEKPPCANWFCKAFDIQSAGIDTVEPLGECTIRIIRSQDFPFFRGGGEARGEIHCVAGHGVFAVTGTASATGNDRSAGNADMDANGTTNPSRHVGYRGVYGQRCASGSFRIVAVRNGGPEDAHDTVADMLVDVSTVLLDDPIGAVEELLEQSMDLFRIELLS